MNKEIASQLIESIVRSIRNDPAQFHFNLNISGVSVRASSGSVGMIVSAIGGGPGSQTTGLHAPVSSNNIEILKQTADSTISQQITQLCETLDEIAKNIKIDDKSTVERLYNSLKNTWVPGVITSIVGNILFSALGITV